MEVATSSTGIVALDRNAYLTVSLRARLTLRALTWIKLLLTSLLILSGHQSHVR